MSVAMGSTLSGSLHTSAHPAGASSSPKAAMTGPQLGPRPAYLRHSNPNLRGGIPRESVYALIEREVEQEAKPPRYTSIYAERVKHEFGGKKSAASMGPAEVPRPDPERWLRKGERERGWKSVVKVEPNRPDWTKLKAPLPDAPGIIPRPTKKDFIKINALDQINSSAKQPPRPPPAYRTKKDYGLVPAYLTPSDPKPHAPHVEKVQHIQSHLKNTRFHHHRVRLADERDNESSEGLVPLPTEEREKILEGLKEQWKRLNGEYQRLSLTVDTVPKIARKVNMEQQLRLLESNIQKFTHPKILVAFDDVYEPALPSSQTALHA